MMGAIDHSSRSNCRSSSSSTPPYEVAKRSILPPLRFHLVEYPGIVKSLDVAIDTLGGHESMAKGFRDDIGRVDLRFRHQNPFAHPIPGDVVSTGNLIIKVTKRKRKIKHTDTFAAAHNACPNPYVEIQTEVIGVASKTARFRSLADFQYLVSDEDSVYKVRQALEACDLDAIEGFELSADAGVSNQLRHIPPPLFSRVEWPVEYEYKQTSVHSKTTNKDTEAAGLKLTSRKSRASKIVAADIANDNVPDGPPPEILETVDTIPEASRIRVRQLFEDRPVFIRGALVNRLPKGDVKILRKLLPTVAYQVTAGPFRDCWIRYGYDPKIDPKSRIYQILDARKWKNLDNKKRNDDVVLHRGGPSCPGPAVPAGTPNEFTMNMAALLGTTPGGQWMVFQLADIDDAELQRVISGTPARKNFTPADGWFEKADLQNIRNAVRKKVTPNWSLGNTNEGDDTTDNDALLPTPVSGDDIVKSAKSSPGVARNVGQVVQALGKSSASKGKGNKEEADAGEDGGDDDMEDEDYQILENESDDDQT
ncbi:hypothetical protein SeMB42_g01287 [Synchytrium endobioticum]|uniref:Transcription factor IIIC subunit 5 HTH domain-containing protein n=1 Tax=Synchytrium endobioticum TaxID=286115 RepID=A0A507DLS2_9FUNG|nr:hypothetical protein SeMB42_g01287 [Synchytrium endobioticum]